jgi:hypothetical protein
MGHPSCFRMPYFPATAAADDAMQENSGNEGNDEMLDWIKAAHDLGVPEAIAMMFMAGLAWVGVRLFGSKSGILTRLGYKGEQFFERYIGLADTLEPAIHKQTETSDKMLELHRDPSSPCNTTPLRRAGIAAADALEAIGNAVHADVTPHVAAIKTALEPPAADQGKHDHQTPPPGVVASDTKL